MDHNNRFCSPDDVFDPNDSSYIPKPARLVSVPILILVKTAANPSKIFLVEWLSSTIKIYGVSLCHFVDGLAYFPCGLAIEDQCDPLLYPMNSPQIFFIDKSLKIDILI